VGHGSGFDGIGTMMPKVEKYSYKLQAVSCKRIQIQLQAASFTLQAQYSLKP
jgi:hypothetical protein